MNPLQVVKRNFRRAIETRRDDAGANSNRRVANHLVMLPWTSGHAPGEYRLKHQRNRARQTNLPTMRMPGHQEIKIRMCSLAVDFGRVRKQNRKLVMWNFAGGFFKILDAIVVGVVDARQMNPLMTSPDRHRFIQ